VTFLAASAEIVEIAETFVHVLQTAVIGRADYLCTLDEHLKDEFVFNFCAGQGITVVSDVDLLRLIRQP
jgi:hypothetical protein